jgi:hypothetical protein
MTCYWPLPAMKRVCKVSGVMDVKVMARHDMDKGEFNVACGQCLGCRLERSRQWAMRCMHESELHEKNCFLTLTYRDDNRPESVQVKDLQAFMKALRKKIDPIKVRFYACGEYAPVKDNYGRVLKKQLGKAHYHLILFGYDFEDKVLWKIKGEHKLYRSEQLETLWKLGNSIIGTVTFESAAYVARYICKKFLGGTKEESKKHYKGKKPEFTTMSRGGNAEDNKGGIGQGWIKKFCKSVYPSDRVIIKGKECMPAKYYDKIFDNLEPEEFEKIKKEREAKALEKAEDNTQYRLETKEKVKYSKVTLTKTHERKLEE